MSSYQFNITSRTGFGASSSPAPTHLPQTTSTISFPMRPKNTNPFLSQSASSYFSQRVMRLTYHICFKFGHSTIECNQGMNFSYQGRTNPPNLHAMLASVDILGKKYLVC